MNKKIKIKPTKKKIGLINGEKRENREAKENIHRLY